MLHLAAVASITVAALAGGAEAYWLATTFTYVALCCVALLENPAESL